ALFSFGGSPQVRLAVASKASPSRRGCSRRPVIARPFGRTRKSLCTGPKLHRGPGFGMGKNAGIFYATFRERPRILTTEAQMPFRGKGHFPLFSRLYLSLAVTPASPGDGSERGGLAV